MKLGTAIKLCRNRKQLKQAELARRAKISESYLSLLELGKRDPTFSTLEAIAQGLELPVSILVFLAADEPELAALAPDVRDKLSSAILRLLQADPDGSQPSLI